MFLVAGLLLLFGATAAAAPRVILPSGKTVTGTAIKADEEGQILLTTAQGILTFPAGTTIVVDEPAAFTRAREFMARKRYAEAIKLFAEVMRTHRFLVWDRRAEGLLAEAQFMAGDDEAAILTYERILAYSPALKDEPTAYNRYLTALQRSGNVAKLLPLLDVAIRTGPRETAARAQLMRGKARLAADEPDAAVLDFMRTADLFRDIAEAQAEAVFYTATTLEQLKDGRAQEYIERMGEEFSDSPFATRLKSHSQ
jgi:tetratricopeptide (TPR) repeat protein